jgi:hypothetical protein
MSYYEKLRDPRWQEKRLEIMKRAGFRCENCGNDKKTLHVHHGYYERGLDPWEYDNDTLWCLCEDCHKDAEEERTFINRMIGKLKPCGAKMEFVTHYLAEDPFARELERRGLDVECVSASG